MAENPNEMDVDETSMNPDEESDSELSEEDDHEEEKQALLAAELEKKVSANVYDYNAHIEYIEACKKLGDLDKLRAARESMSNYFPLTAELWLSWLQDEINIASTEEDAEKIISLFERAVQDYLSVELWTEYIQFSIGKMSGENGEEKVRNVIERALTAAGLHGAKGVTIWELFREFELALLNVLEQQALHSDTPQIKEAVLAQKRKIAGIFQRQLAVPLLDMEETYKEFQTWRVKQGEEKIVDVKAVEHGYKTALQKLSRILGYEEALSCAEPNSRLEIYQQYLNYEKNQREGGNDPGRVQCLYERAVTDHCLVPQFWVDYVNYAISTIKIKEIILKLLVRATRNCPWCADIWLTYLKQLEYYDEPIETVTGVLEQALTAGFTTAQDYRSIWFGYIVYLRRIYSKKNPEERGVFEEKIRATIERAYEHIVQLFGTEGDPDCELLVFWAKWEAVKPDKSMEKVRNIYNDILTINKTKSSQWLQCLAIERYYGDEKHLRRLFARALSTDTDYPEGIAAMWLEYEQLEGTLESYEICSSKITERLQQEKLKKEKQSAAEARRKTGPEKNKKGKKTDAAQQEKKAEETPTVKKGKWENLGGKRPHEPEEKKDGKFKVPNTSSEPVDKKSKLEDFGAVEHHDAEKDSRTVFISNLDYSVTDEKIKTTINKLGFNVSEIRLVKDFKGRSKGFCYVVLESELEAQGLLKKDRERLDERPMFISSCVVDKMGRSKGLKFSTELEKHKLFVKGIPVSMKEDELEKIFKEFGRLKGVRLATYRNGHSKGIAYIEYYDEESAKSALLKTDGTDIGGQQVSVAFSKPPERKNQTSLIPSNSSEKVLVQSLGGGPKEYGSRGKSRTQIMLPRSLQLSSSANSSNSSSSIPMNGNSAGSSGTNGNAAEKPSLSNSDFRNMLLGIK